MLMGQWVITIQGTGCHNNPGNAGDAEKMGMRFVESLQNAGHMIESATFVAGSRQHIQPLPLDAGVPLDC